MRKDEEILEALKELSISHAVLHEKVESHLKKCDKESETLSRLEKASSRHDIFMRVSIWAYTTILGLSGIKFFPWK